ncbi:MAG: hypothetical protein OEV44_01315 [Spirochaetota bacterium]|nr:hypothetical protein [Spirochaetota bacterium]
MSLVNLGTLITIEDELKSNVGSSKYTLGNLALFKGNSDFEIWTGIGRTGTKLIESTDYIISDIDNRATGLLGFNLYTKVIIINATYQTGNLYHYYKQYGNYVNAEDMEYSLTNIELLKQTISGYFFGLGISNNTTDANNDIDIAIGKAGDDTGAFLISLGTAITKRLDAIWAAGNNQGGLDTGTKAINTWYYLWLISNGTNTDVLFSTSKTSPTMPAGYIYKKRIIGAIRTNSSGNIIAFSQIDKYFFYKTEIADLQITNVLATASTPVTVTAPINTIGIFNMSLVSGVAVAVNVFKTGHNDSSGLASFGWDLYADTNVQLQKIHIEIPVDVSNTISYRSSITTGTFIINTKGFIDIG